MATEKWIRRKYDDADHEGKRSEFRRLAKAEDQVINYLEGSDGKDLLGEATEKITAVQLRPDPQLTITNKKFRL